MLGRRFICEFSHLTSCVDRLVADWESCYRIINLQMEGSSGSPGPETGESSISLFALVMNQFDHLSR